MATEPDDPMDLDRPFQCWCGAVGTFEEMFDNEVYRRGCHGTGTLNCICGGDFCVCHHHGEVECDGCEDCDFDRDDLDYADAAWRDGEAHGHDD